MVAGCFDQSLDLLKPGAHVAPHVFCDLSAGHALVIEVLEFWLHAKRDSLGEAAVARLELNFTIHSES